MARFKVRNSPDKSCTPPNLVAADGYYSGADHPLAEASASFGQTSSAIQLQLGPLSTDTGLSTVVQSVQELSEWEQAGLATSLTSSREHCCGSEAYGNEAHRTISA